MGSDQEKIEKKRLKAQVKAEKARTKAGLLPEPEKPQAQSAEPQPKIPWHKDPNWVRAIIAIVTLVVMLVTLIITIL